MQNGPLIARQRAYEWADIHFGPSSSRARSRSRSNGDGATPTPRRMPAILAAQRDRRLAEEMAEAMVSHAEEDRERRGVRQFRQSSSSRPSRPIPTNDDENYHQDSIGLASFFHIGLCLESCQHSRTTDGISLDKVKDQKRLWCTTQETFLTLWRVAEIQWNDFELNVSYDIYMVCW